MKAKSKLLTLRVSASFQPLLRHFSQEALIFPSCFNLQCPLPVHFNTVQPCALTSDRKGSASRYALWFCHRQTTDTHSLSLFNTHRHRGTETKGLQEQRPGYDKTLKNTEENSETEWAAFKKNDERKGNDMENIEINCIWCSMCCTFIYHLLWLESSAVWNSQWNTSLQ